jgi:hypothetical protein
MCTVRADEAGAAESARPRLDDLKKSLDLSEAQETC